MAIRLSIGNHKGGVGKSTSAMMVAESLALYRGLRVLVLDFDPQASLSAMFLSTDGVHAAGVKGRTLLHLLRAVAEGRPLQLSKYITPKVSDLSELKNAADFRRVDLIASSTTLLQQYAQIEDAVRAQRAGIRADKAIADALHPELHALDKSYDVILFDCPGGVGSLSLAALRLSHALIAPTSLDDISLRALMDFIKIILQEDLDVLGRLQEFKVLVTMLVRNNPEQRRLLDHLRSGIYKLDALPRAISHSVAVQRATTRLRPDSFRTAREKYADALSDVEALSKSILQVVHPKKVRT